MPVNSVTYTRAETRLGPIWLAASDRGLCTIGLGDGQPESFLSWLHRRAGSEVDCSISPLLLVCLTQIREYLDGVRRKFDLPLDIVGTAFQKEVWEQAAQIGYAQTISYGDLARRIDRPRAVRAVGAALGANPLPIVIPCHRIIGSDGSLVGYAGGLEIKEALLRMERARAV
ncbi:MAG: methylated-DNA--[protein]-cysteine S-methyltransferase [Chloroflexi bacterium]|nr:methylated-DNA--[protein]-cysteine S-methyltransferase [Chloroflexota bacterium]